MNDQVDDLKNTIRSEMISFLLELKTSSRVSHETFKSLEGNLKRFLTYHKQIGIIEKTFLADMYALPHSMRNEAEYNEEKNFLEEAANRMEGYFGMLLSREDPNDRQPGVPRVC